MLPAGRQRAHKCRHETSLSSSSSSSTDYGRCLISACSRMFLGICFLLLSHDLCRVSRFLPGTGCTFPKLAIENSVSFRCISLDTRVPMCLGRESLTLSSLLSLSVSLCRVQVLSCALGIANKRLLRGKANGHLILLPISPPFHPDPAAKDIHHRESFSNSMFRGG